MFYCCSVSGSRILVKMQSVQWDGEANSQTSEMLEKKTKTLFNKQTNKQKNWFIFPLISIPTIFSFHFY